MIVDHCAGGSGRFVVSLAVQMRPVEEVIDPPGQRLPALTRSAGNARCAAAMDVVPMTRGSPDPRYVEHVRTARNKGGGHACDADRQTTVMCKNSLPRTTGRTL